MSVYTPLNEEQIIEILSNYSIGKSGVVDGIKEGITNSNYFLKTSVSEYVLTIFEDDNVNLDFCLNYMEHLARKSIPCPQPIQTNSNDSYILYDKKKLAIFSKLKGQTVSNAKITNEMCSQVGKVLAQMHMYSEDFKKNFSGVRNRDWFLNTYNKVQGELNIENSSLLDEEIKRYLDYDCKELPTGIIHSDLFRDNVMFQENTLTGVLDFYYACNGYFIYDLAITVNDWCTNSTFKIDHDKQKSLIEAYEQVRRLRNIEKKEWNTMLRFASLRFWLSRLNDQLFPTDGDLTTVLDPDHFKNILKDRKNYSDKLE